MQDIIIYHNPDCGTSRNTLAMIRNAGLQPHVIPYLLAPPDRALLSSLIDRIGITPHALLRQSGTPYADLGLHEGLSRDEILDAMQTYPILINRPIVITASGVRLCRPSELVLEILPTPQQHPFTKEDGTPVSTNPVPSAP